MTVITAIAAKIHTTIKYTFKQKKKKNQRNHTFSTNYKDNACIAQYKGYRHQQVVHTNENIFRLRIYNYTKVLQLNITECSKQ